MASLAGSFLVARAVLKDPNFAQAVVLLLEHDGNGAFGVVVNRPLKAKGVPFPVYGGGPCESEGLIMLHGHAEWAISAFESSESEVTPGIWVGDDSCASRIADPEVDDDLKFRMFKGYAGWGSDQLEQELSVGAWSVVKATPELLFETPPGDLWDRLAAPAIPQFSAN